MSRRSSGGVTSRAASDGTTIDPIALESGTLDLLATTEPTMDFGSVLDDNDPHARESVTAPPPAPRAGVRAQDTVPAEPTPSRFEFLAVLGEGGMGQVWRVRDRVLNRTMAMKVIRRELLDRAPLRARFVEEAQCSAQLQHPGIVPVHELGTLPDGRVYFTMREVRGQTLTEVNAAQHARSDALAFRRLIEAFVKVCEAVGFAHARGVVHRDLKPDNVMVGGHGEVLVVDWGLAKVLGSASGHVPDSDEDVVVTSRAGGATRVGHVAGTPAYMAPEQARGEVDRIDARTDVYALGAVLYELLSGHPPYQGSARDVLTRVIEGPPPPLHAVRTGDAAARAGHDTMPDELVLACATAMARDPEERFATAGALGAAVLAWLDGARRREQALALVREAEGIFAQAHDARARGSDLRVRGAAMLEHVAAAAPEDRKAGAWKLQDEADRVEREAVRRDAEGEQRLLAALTVEPSLADAHAWLVDRHLLHHADAERRHATDDCVRAETRVHTHAEALPSSHPTRVRATAYLKGDGALTLVTDPPGAEVFLYRYVEHNRRLTATFVRPLGTTPVRALSLPMGSYLCVVRAEGYAEMRYPVRVGRGEHWDGVPPEGGDPAVVPLLPATSVDPEDCYVPAGWFQSGIDPWAAPALPARRVWVDGWIVRRFPVTTREYRAFLDDLVATGQVDDAHRHAPRLRGDTPGVLGAPVLSFTDGRFVVPAPDAPNAVQGDAPVTLVDWFGAGAFAAWLAARTGQPWTLPRDLCWEKAARGVDGRAYPWGDRFDASWCCMRDSNGGRAAPATVESFPVDESPYGVRGTSGNVRDWCGDIFWRSGPQVEGGREIGTRMALEAAAVQLLRGGTWFCDASFGRVTDRFGMAPYFRYEDTGFRVARRVGTTGGGPTP